MAAFSRSVLDKLKKQQRFTACELCGGSIPRLKNRGLQAAHIVAEKDRGTDDEPNAIVLCHSCAEAFDRFLKAKIAKAFRHINQRSGTQFACPDGWEDGEGRRAKGDEV
jgi:predicted restriction endonuclease